jgi:Tfp pilus assembly protein PilV
MRPLRSGMTLIETVIAMSVLVVGTLSVFDSLLTARKVNDRATNTALAYQEIQAQIETMQNMPYVDVWQKFSGIGFQVAGLQAQKTTTAAGLVKFDNRLPVGTVTRLSNANFYDTSATNPNAFDTSNTYLPLRFRVEWKDDLGDTAVEIIYVLVYRGI